MKITWFGTASLMIESERQKILFDPYLRNFNKRLPRFPLEEIAKVKAIFITHPHLDHFADIPEILKYTKCPVYTNERGLELAKQFNFDLSRIKAIQVGDVFTFGNLTIEAYQGRHVVFDKPLVRRTIARVIFRHPIKGTKIARQNKRFSIGLNDIFTFYLRKGRKSLMIMGSANKDENTDYPRPDVLIYPYQGRTDILDYSLNLVKSLSPMTVICDHFDDAFPPVSAKIDAEQFKSRLESETHIKVIVPKEREGIVIL